MPSAPGPGSDPADGQDTGERPLAAGAGDLERNYASLYDELRGIAHRHLSRERGDHTLSTTALVHESYLNLAEGREARWRDRSHFLALASRTMRHVLVDYARQRAAQKRGGDRIQVAMRPDLAAVEGGGTDVIALDDALKELATLDERLEKVVECRFFGGMTVEETAEAMGLSRRTVERDWTRARTYLYELLHPDG